MEQKIKIEEKGLTPVKVDRQTTKEYRTKSMKSKQWTEDTLVPITSDIMFKTMKSEYEKKKVYMSIAFVSTQSA